MTTALFRVVSLRTTFLGPPRLAVPLLGGGFAVGLRFSVVALARSLV
jgi:hypothetical protein